MFKKSLFLFLALIVFSSFSVFAQKTRPVRKPAPKNNLVKPAAKAGNEKESLEKALAQTDLSAKITALQEFTQNFPKSENKTRALEIIVSSRAQLADQKLRAGETGAAVALFKEAVTNAPTPISEKLFADIIVQFPTNLFYGGQQAAAVEVAKLIEEKVKDNPKQLLGLASFYLGTENAAEAKNLADAAIALDSNLSAAYQTLGLANRLSFHLEDSTAAYAKALEIDPNSVVSKRSLAEMQRALGKSDEAATLYRELVEKDANDGASSNGLILSLFDANKKPEAEELLSKSLDAYPNNFPLLVGAAYWYAAHNEGGKAVDLAQKALAIESRYTWAYIAMARGLAAQNRPLDAEKSLLLARQYGNFPTLDYELASVRMSAGFYQEAANELKKSFAIKDGLIETKLANRVPKQAANFIELVELERRASIFEPIAADTTENAEKVKALLSLNQVISSSEATEEQLNQAVDEFTKGSDKMKTHRQLYAADRLLQAKKNLPKAYELTQSAIRGVDDSLTVNNPAAAVLADELLESRTLAISRGELIVVPEVPKQMLSQVLRGRIEDLAGWTLYQQQKPQEAAVRLKRAVSILPEKSSFWRTSMWHLGAAYDADNKTKEALDAYIKSYTNGQPDIVKRSVIEIAYQKVNGNLDGLDDKIGARPISETVAQATNTPVPEVSPAPDSTPTAEATTTPQITETAPTPTASPETITTPTPVPFPSETPKVETTPETTTEVSPAPTIEATPEKTPESSPTPSETSTATPEVKIEPTPTMEVSPTVAPEVSPSAEATPTVESKTETPTVSETATAANLSKTAKETQSATRNPKIKLIKKTDATLSQAETPTGESLEKTSTNKLPKPLFDPVVINVPQPQIKKDDAQKTDENTTKQTNVSDNSRPRVILIDKLKNNELSVSESCLVASQENISILNQGGNLGVLIGYNKDEDISKISAESSSPEDVTITRDTDSKASNRAFFVIKSVSAKTGEIPVTFISPCGKKEIRVTVR
jgi:tetratricopeptide (TPR) repeat protein